VDALRRRIAEAAPELGRGAVALIDSPHLPRDLDLARATRQRRDSAPRSRALDAALRELLVRRSDGIARPFRWSLFPTPRVEYFARCANSANCKPHLLAIAHELLGAFIPAATRRVPPAVTGGAIFTRFMLAGFACYPVLTRMGVEPLESYPTLVFNLWSSDGPVPPKGKRGEALEARRAIVERLRRVVGVPRPVAAANLDQADAAVLALAAAAASRGDSLVVLGHPAEGRFAVPLPPRQHDGSLVDFPLKIDGASTPCYPATHVKDARSQ